jgi:hypothetical protein
LLMYFLNDFWIVSIVPIITGITFVFTFHMRYVSILKSSYFRNLYYYQLCLVISDTANPNLFHLHHHLRSAIRFRLHLFHCNPESYRLLSALSVRVPVLRQCLTDRQSSANYCSSLITWCCQHRETN